MKTISALLFPVFALFASLGFIPTAEAKDPLPLEFSKCLIPQSRPIDSRFIQQDLLLSNAGTQNRYYVDVYQLNRKNPNPLYRGYLYQVKAKAKGPIIGYFKMEYKRVLPMKFAKSQWAATFSGCGPINVRQDYPVITYMFYDTTIGIKLTGLRNEVELGQVSSPNPANVFGAINQLDGPDFGN
jgi:hypothetical protein